MHCYNIFFFAIYQQHDRHHTMLANPYDPSRDLSPNLPTTSCRGQDLTNVFGVVGVVGGGSGSHGQCCTFKSEFDDDCATSDCCSKVSPPPPPPPISVMGRDDFRSGPLQAVPCKQELETAGHGLGSSPSGHHHNHQLLHHHHHHHLGGGYGSPPEPSSSPPPSGHMTSYGSGGAYESSPPAADMMVRPKREQAEVNLCDGCGLKILDRYYLFAVDKRWHATCLQCSQCARTLATEIKCFYRDGNIYCKADYQR